MSHIPSCPWWNMTWAGDPAAAPECTCDKPLKPLSERMAQFLSDQNCQASPSMYERTISAWATELRALESAPSVGADNDPARVAARMRVAADHVLKNWSAIQEGREAPSASAARARDAVGELVAKWRKEAGALAIQYGGPSYGTAKRDCADELEALSRIEAPATPLEAAITEDDRAWVRQTLAVREAIYTTGLERGLLFKTGDVDFLADAAITTLEGDWDCVAVAPAKPAAVREEMLRDMDSYIADQEAIVVGDGYSDFARCEATAKSTATRYWRAALAAALGEKG